LDDTVTFLDPMPQSELRVLLDQSTCLVLPSRAEGLGRVNVEAMARARPVVASAVGGIPELVDDGHTGRLVPPEDVTALADALVEVLQDREMARAMGQEARRRAVERAPHTEYEEGIARLAGWISTR